MGQQLTKRNVRDRTLEYWEEKPGYRCYIDELLGEELKAAKNDNENPRRLQGVGQPVHTLALTVGESFEPLLQTICVLRPQRIILILNQRYGNKKGKEYGHNLSQLILYLVGNQNLPEEFRPQLLEKDIQIRELPADSPTQVFRTLLEEFQKSEAQPPAGYTNVVDITGAKKSMIAGAFFYAAHSGLPITYVDFDKYDPDWRRPYGYTCKIGQIANPYEAFHLRDWEQVRRLYESYSFRNALAMLGKDETSGIRGAMAWKSDDTVGESLFEKSDRDKVTVVARLFEMYEAWENGDYALAKQMRDSFNPRLPDDVVPWSIDALGDIWPNVALTVTANQAALELLNKHLALKQGSSSPADSLFAQPKRLLAYVRDELAKIERLIEKNEDYRSTYLRAAALDEFLLKARLCVSWLNNSLDIKVANNPPVTVTNLSHTDQIRGFKNLVEHSGADIMRETLRRRRSLNLSQVNMEVRLRSNAPSLHPYWSGTTLDMDALQHDSKPCFTKLRGEAIHTHLYLPRSIAEAALELVRAAVDEFERNWLEHFHPGTLASTQNKVLAAPLWPRLCEVCELTFLPPRLRS